MYHQKKSISTPFKIFFSTLFIKQGLLLLSLYSFYLLIELFNIAYLLNGRDIKFDGNALINYIYLSFPSRFSLFFPISFMIAFLFSIWKLHKTNFFLLMSILGKDPDKLLKSTFFVFYSFFILIFVSNEFVFKKMLKEAYIVYEDDLIEQTTLSPRLHLATDYFIESSNDHYFVYSNVILDPINSDFPIIYNVLSWEKNTDTSTEYFTYAPKGIIKENNIQLLGSKTYILDQHYDIKEERKISLKLLKYPIRLDPMQSIHIETLDILELIKIIFIFEVFSVNDFTLYFYLVSPVILLLFLPFLAFSIRNKL